MAANKLKLFHQFGKKIIGIGMNYRYVTFMCDGHHKVYHLKLSFICCVCSMTTMAHTIKDQVIKNVES